MSWAEILIESSAMTKCLFIVAILVVNVVQAYGQDCAASAREIKPELSASARENYEKKLSEARTIYAANPSDVDAIIWLGRRTAYLGEYKAAIKILTDGIAKFPSDARFYRHRGHRLITLRCFDGAIADLERALTLIRRNPDEIEPDGLPNAKNTPTSTLHTNIYYHLGLAYYLKGDFSFAATHFMNSYNRSKNPDMLVASAYWVYMSAARFGARKNADGLLKKEIKNDLELIENHDYYKLIKLNKGLLKAEDLLSEISGDAKTLGSASLGYGIGNYFLYNGDNAKAQAVFQKIVAGNQWSSFGYIAAEVELARMGAKKGG